MRNKARKFGKFLVEQALKLPAVALLVAGHGADVLSTWYAVTRCGAKEGNPLIAPLVNSQWRGKWVILSAVKAWALQDVYEVMDLHHILVSSALVWAVVGWNIFVAFSKRRQYGRTSN